MDIALAIVLAFSKFSTFIENILMQGFLSEILFFVFFAFFLKHNFSASHKTKNKGLIEIMVPP